MQHSRRANTRLGHLRANMDRWGWRKALFKFAINGAARYLGTHIYVVRIRAIPREPEYPATNPNLEFRKIESQELREASTDLELNMNPEFVNSAIARGDLAFGAFDGNVLVSYIWRSVGFAPDADGVWVKVRKPYNYSYKSFTRPEYRGQRISPVAHLFSDNEMRKLGYRYRAGFVSIANFSSLRMGRKMGSQTIGHAGYLAWFGQLIPFRSRAVREIGFEFFQA